MMDPALLIWIPILALLLAPAVLIIFSRRAAPMRKLGWVSVVILGYLVGEYIASLYAKDRVNPLHPDFSELLTAMVIELSSTLALVWLAYAGFLFHTRRRK